MKKTIMLGLMTVAASALSANQYYDGRYYNQGYYQPSYNQGNYYQPGYDSQGYYNQGNYYQPYGSVPQNNYYQPEQGCSSVQGQYQGMHNGYATDMNHPKFRTEEDRNLYKSIQDSLQGKYNVQAFVDDGNVTLQGMVNSQDEKRDIEQKVSSMRGVRNVNSQLQVQGQSGSGNWRPGTDRLRSREGNEGYSNNMQGSDRMNLSDNDIAKKAQYDLANYQDLEVSVRNGDVTLAGVVNSQEEKDAVERKVRSMRGVRNVTNNIKVRSGSNRGY